MSAVAKKKPTNSRRKRVKTDPHSWAGRIAAVRERLNITQAEAAARVGVPTRTLMGWEYGLHQPGRLAQLRLKQVFPEM